MSTEQKMDTVTHVLDSFCRDIKKGERVPNPHALTLAMSKLLGSSLWMPPGNIFAIRKSASVSWGTEEAVLNKKQSRTTVARLLRKLSSYV